MPPMATPEETSARAIAAEHGNRPDALLEILHNVQAEFGIVPSAAVPALADALHLSRAEVHGVVTKVTAVQVGRSNGLSEWQQKYDEQARNSRRITPVTEAAE